MVNKKIIFTAILSIIILSNFSVTAFATIDNMSATLNGTSNQIRVSSAATISAAVTATTSGSGNNNDWKSTDKVENLYYFRFNDLCKHR